ncbi:hypothetical protein IFT54_05440 [Sphingomonas sp. CFBP 13714]|uniref:hypothetical protein n=1 Tax=Sphingomonas sp. CFBP 13714 TaxID=2775308 RepID=UPI00178061B5|nr:hypothetical protein [Sphingomonas sp. CFBP 13714]MBD8699258.1 hypothetical protein [Sphingomonas sp. CFBP 13714]
MGKRTNKTPSLRQQHFVEYQAWINMIHRCHNPKHFAFDMYGAKNISVCSEWRSYETGFAQFIKDMKPKPNPLYSLERKDGTKGYSKSNCEWADRKTQQLNRGKPRQYQLDFGLGTAGRGNSPMIEYQGEIKSLSKWAVEFNIKPPTLRQRLKRGMDIATALNPANMKRGSGHKRVIKQITTN